MTAAAQKATPAVLLSRDDLLPPARPPGMRRGLVLAIAAHVLLVLGLAVGVSWRSSEPAGTEAELWAAVPQAAAPPAAEPPPPPPPVAAVKPAPAPRPEPVAAPKPRPDAQIAIEKDKEKARKERLKKEEELQEQKERKERERKQEQLKREEQLAEKAREDKKKKEAAEQKKKQQQDTERELAQAAAQREAQIKRILNQAGSAGGTSSTGNAEKTAGPSAGYAGRIIGAVRPNITFPNDVSGNPAAEVEVRLASDGSVLGRRLAKSSGVKEWDDAVLRAIDKTERFPRDTDGRVPSQLTLVFTPKNLS